MPTREYSKELGDIKNLLESHNSEARDTIDRMDRLEDKIEKLTDAVVAIARAEEKISSIVSTIASIDNRMYKIEERVGDLEQSNAIIHKSISINTKFFWITITAFVTLIITSIIF